jgi:type II secretory pathway pseudopilin PulG
MKRRSKKGFVLLEVMLAAAIAAFAICGILLTYITGMDLIRISRNASIATSAAQGVLERIRSTPFPDITSMIFLVNGTSYPPIVVNSNLTRWNFPLSVNNLPANRCAVYVDDTDPEFLLITISVCWRQGNKVIGEDANLNGALDAGEDINGNSIIDSTVELVTQVANR